MRFFCLKSLVVGVALWPCYLLAEKPVTLAEAKSRYMEADKELNIIYREMIKKLPKNLQYTLREDQQLWVEYKMRLAKKTAKGAQNYLDQAWITRQRTKYVRHWKNSLKLKVWDGIYVDGLGGKLRLEKVNEGLHFKIEVERYPSLHTGVFEGTAKIHGDVFEFPIFSQKLTGAKDETLIVFDKVGAKNTIRVLSSNTDTLHGKDAKFDGFYVYVKPINEIDEPKVNLPTPSPKKLREVLQKYGVITNKTPDAEVEAIKNIELSRRGVTSAELSHLSLLPHLNKLSLRYSDVISVKPLEGMKNLSELTIYGAEVKNLTFLAGLEKLTKLNLGRNDIEDLRPLTELSQLEELHIGHNMVTSLSPLSQLTKLRILHLEGMNLDDFSVVKTLPSLESVIIHRSEENVKKVEAMMKSSREAKPKFEIKYDAGVR